MVSKPKSIIIEVEFGSFKELDYVLSLAVSMAKKGINSERFKSNQCLINYQMNYTTEIDYREEVINGQLCQIFKSKM